MTVLWMVLIALLAVGLTLWPLWAAAPRGGVQRRTLSVEGYRTRLQEIEVEQAVGSISAEAAQALRDEAAARLLADTDATAPAAAAKNHGGRAWGVAAVGAILILALSGLGYWFGDSRQVAGWIAQADTDPAAAQQLSIDSMIARLERRLEVQPDDVEGWAMLGRSYFVTGQREKAAGAYERANRLSAAAPMPDLLADEGEVRVLLQEHDLRGLPRQLFERALAIDPGQPKALWYGGLAAAQGGDFGLALDRWLALRKTELPDEFRATLDQRLQELAELAGRPLDLGAADAPSTVVAAAPPPQAAANTPEALVLEVRLDPALAASVGASDTLFVVARRPDAPGPPLAVQRLGAAALPTTVTLDDSNAMAPAFKLSMADRWDVIARISRSGTATAQSGDLEGRLSLDRSQLGKPVELLIDRRVP